MTAFLSNFEDQKQKKKLNLTTGLQGAGTRMRSISQWLKNMTRRKLKHIRLDPMTTVSYKGN